MKAALLMLLAIPFAGTVAQHADDGHGQADRPDAHGPHAGDSMPDASVDGHEGHDGHDFHNGHDASDGHDGHDAGTSRPSSEIPRAAPPPAAFSGPEHAADAVFGAAGMSKARDLLLIEGGGFRTGTALADRLETRAGDGREHYVWDLQGWYGGDLRKLWWKSEGGGELGSNPEDAEVQALYSRAVTPFFDVQAGIRHDFEPSPRRSHAVVGIQGLLPYVFEIDAAAFVSEEGDLTGRFEVEYDLRIRQRLVLQPRVELDFSAQAIPELGVGAGLGSVEGGLRLRYEIRREIAPYVGVAWQRKRGATADFARAAGDDSRSWEVVVGVRAWF